MARTEFRWLPVTTLPSGAELRLPMHQVVGAHPGPTLGISAAIHGNEVFPSNGIVQRILEHLDPAELRGTVIAIPVLNPPAFAEKSRNTPADGMNLNDAFVARDDHGHPEPIKSISIQIAEVITNEFLSKINHLIDFHSGGDNHSVHMIEFTDDPVSTSMARAFNMPILLRDVWMPGQMWTMAETYGVSTIVAELGGNGTLYDEWTTRGVAGTFNVMRQLDMLPGDVVPPPRQYVVNNTPGHEANLNIFRPSESGLIIPDLAITPQCAFDGQPVEGIPVLGRLLNPYNMTIRQEFPAPFARTLMLATTVAPSWNVAGEFAYILADADIADIWG